MKLRSIVVPVCVLIAFGGAVLWLLFANPPTAPEQSPISHEQVAATSLPIAPAETSSASAGLTTAAPLPDNIRDVSPDGVSAPKVTSNLKRIEPSKRYLELKNPPIEPIPDGPLEFKRVQVLDAGHLKAGRLTIKLAHIDHLALDETCKSMLDGTWPCGTRARTFLRGLVRQLKVTCEKIEELGPQKILATCKRGTIDLSSRLVRYGWASPKEDAPAPLLELASSAQEMEFGKWQQNWFTEASDLPEWAETDTLILPDLEIVLPEIVDWSQQTDLFFNDDGAENTISEAPDVSNANPQ